jgi:VanZ family protein
MRTLRCFTIAYWLVLTYLVAAPDPLWFLGGSEAEQVSSFHLASFWKHLAAYGLLGVLVRCSVEGAPHEGRFVWLGLAVLHGLLFEGLQFWIPQRFAEWSDAAANVSGVCFGWMAAVIMMRCVPSLLPGRRYSGRC